MEKQQSGADHMLLSRLLGFEPLACARRANGDLVYLNLAGQKFVLTPAEIDALTHKNRSVSQEQNAETSALSLLQANIREGESANKLGNIKSRSHHKKITDPSP